MSNTPTGESKIAGVSIRSWNATVIICIGTAALVYHALTTGEIGELVTLIFSAVSFLFGKAAGAAQKP